MGVSIIGAIFAIGLLAGFIKGAVGFGMPMIMISGLSAFVPVETALGILLLPTLASNGTQAFRQGARAAWVSVKKFRLFLIVGFVFLVVSAQMLPYLSPTAHFLLIGVPVSFFATLQLTRWQFKIVPKWRKATEAAIAALAGSVGGVSGVWGPPTVLFLTAMDTPKQEHVRVQGVVYGLGAFTLILAHIRSGVVSSETFPLSVLMLIPAGIGMLIGFKVQDRLDQARFRQITLIVLLIAGLNLVRRALI